MFGLSAAVTAPPKSKGAYLLTYYPIDSTAGPKAWFYIPGQRRVRPAPEFSYDIPVGGTIFWDEVSGFLGRMDRFDFKLIGKQEMLVPYNVFGVTNTVREKDFLGKNFLSPDAVRWEKHRVWVVDALRKPEAHHTFSRRTYYIDEDCWCITQTDAYDDAGKLVRVGQVNSFPSYVTGGINLNGWSDYDLAKGGYYIFNSAYAEEGRHIREYDTAEGLRITLTPQAVIGNSSQ